MKSSSRNGARVIWLVLHTTEGIMRATDLRAWTAWPGSSHAACDETGVLLTPAEGFVPYDRAAWTLRNGNPISENIEQCAFAKWTRAEWLARPKLLDATARWLADRSKARGIPLRRLSHAEVRARNVPGVIMHDDYSKATGDGTHWDCGPGYPWDVVLEKARAYAGGDDMYGPAERDELITRVDKALGILQALHPAVAAMHVGLMDPSTGVRTLVLQLAGRDPVAVDAAELAETLAPMLAPALAAKVAGASEADVQQAIREVLGSLDDAA